MISKSNDGLSGVWIFYEFWVLFFVGAIIYMENKCSSISDMTKNMF